MVYKNIDSKEIPFYEQAIKQIIFKTSKPEPYNHYVLTYISFKFDNSEDLYYVDGRFKLDQRQHNKDVGARFTGWANNLEYDNGKSVLLDNEVLDKFKDFFLVPGFIKFRTKDSLLKRLKEYLVSLLDNPITLENEVMPTNLENKVVPTNLENKVVPTNLKNIVMPILKKNS